MVKEFPVRYGRNYKVVLVIVLPGLLIIPFILSMQFYNTLDEWKIWLIIFIFLGVVISLSVWLELKVYPKAVLTIRKNEISLSFDSYKFLSPSDFTFNISDITSFTTHQISGEEYFLIKTQNPIRKFQVSSSSNSIDDYLALNEVMVAVSESLIVK